MSFALYPLSQLELEDIAACRAWPQWARRLEPDALPPAFVAVRALALLAQGHAAPWATTFLIVRERDDRIVGGCGFKSIPHNGRVELGYGVAPAAQRQGAATEAVRRLVRKAFAAGAEEVLAEVSPTNQASVRVVEKTGFAPIGERIDEQGELVVQWIRRAPTGPG